MAMIHPARSHCRSGGNRQRNQVTVYAMDTVAFGFHNADESNLVEFDVQTGARSSCRSRNMYKDISVTYRTSQDAGNYAIQVVPAAIPPKSRSRFSNRLPPCIGENHESVHYAVSPDLRTNVRRINSSATVQADRQYVV